jgi:hypothetical protein
MNQEPIEYYAEALANAEDILLKLWQLLYTGQTYEYYGQVFANIQIELALRKAICDLLIPFYETGYLPKVVMPVLDRDIQRYREWNKNGDRS